MDRMKGFIIICLPIVLLMSFYWSAYAEKYHPLDGLAAEQIGRRFCRSVMGSAFENAKDLSFDSLHQDINNQREALWSRMAQKSHIEDLVIKKEISPGYALPLVGLEERDLALQELHRSSIFTVGLWSVAFGDRPRWKTPNGIPFNCAAVMRLTCPAPGKLREVFEWFSSIPVIRNFFPIRDLVCEWRVVAYKTLNKSKYIDQLMNDLNGSGLPADSVLDEQAINMYALAAAANKPGTEPYTAAFREEEKKALKELEHLHTTFLEEQLGLNGK